jgi:hypothetical protein
LILSCSRNRSVAELNDTFSKNKDSLDLLVKSLQDDKKLDSLFFIGPDSGIPDIEKTYPQIFDLIKHIGITDASSHKNSNCKKAQWYYFKTNWSNGYPIYLIYNTCDEKAVKGIYKKDEYLNETWGLGDNWQMFRFVDTIKNIKQ